MSKQAQLNKWTAGFFDGDGSIVNGISDGGRGGANGITYNPRCELSNTYPAGFFDAEGTLLTTVKESNNYDVGSSFLIQAQTTQTGPKIPGLEKLKLYCEQVDANYTLRHKEKRKENHADQWTITVSGVEAVEKFLSGLLPHLATKRPQAEIMLNDIIPLVKRKEHLNRRGFLRVMKHADKLNEFKGGKRGKYSLDYFEEKWGMELDK